jgi:hypothetical protein
MFDGIPQKSSDYESIFSYNEYQQYLYETISNLPTQHWALLKLANYLNDNKILVVKGKSFASAHAYYTSKKRIKANKYPGGTNQYYQDSD